MSSLPPQVQAALIGAIVAIGVMLVRDVALKLWESRQEKRRSVQEVFRRYSDPLAFSATNLLWRLDEIFHGSGRGAYLLVDAHATKFAEYKRLSTLHRLTALLGWIRAFRRELSFLRTNRAQEVANIRQAISDFEAALADGAHVESKRLSGLVDLWQLSAQPDDRTREETAIAVEQALKVELHENDVLVARELPEERQRALCLELAQRISQGFDVPAPTNAVVSETIARAVQCLSYREAWIYRDWQAGLGDLVIRPMDSGPRMFDIIGFKEFERLAIEGSEEDQRWIARVNDLFENLDASGRDSYDVRYEQLCHVLRATAGLIIALSNADTQHRTQLETTIELARKILEADRLPLVA